MPINMILVQTNRVKYKPVKTTAKVETITEDELNSSFNGINKKTKHNEKPAAEQR